MSVRARRVKAAEKREGMGPERQMSRLKSDMLEVLVQQSCGCCDDHMFFWSKEHAIAAFASVGLESSAKIVDSTGEEHVSIDTFYGFQVVREAQSSALSSRASKLGVVIPISKKVEVKYPYQTPVGSGIGSLKTLIDKLS